MEINENNSDLNNENDNMYLFYYFIIFRDENINNPKNEKGISELYDKISIKKYI